MIGYWHNPVVCLSVCDGVHSGFRGWCTGLKVVPAGMFLFVPSLLLTLLLYRTYRLGTKCTTQKRVEEIASVSFFHDHHVCVLVYSD